MDTPDLDIVWNREALLDLEASVLYIQDHSYTAAEKFRKDILVSIESLRKIPGTLPS